MKELRDFGKIRCENKVVNLKTHRKIYPISKNVCGTDKNVGSGTDKNVGHNDIPIKEEEMNDSAALHESSSFSFENKKSIASPVQDFMKLYEFIHANDFYSWECKLCKNSFERWYKLGPNDYILKTL